MVAEFETRGDSFIASTPRLWSPGYLTWSGFTNLELAPDGKRFAVFLRPDSEGSGQPRRVTALLSFFDDLERRLPNRK